MKSHEENDNGIEFEEDILKQLCFQTGITGTTYMLMDSGQFQGPIIYNTFKSKTGSISTHEIKFTNTNADVIQLSGISDPEKVTKKTGEA